MKKLLLIFLLLSCVPVWAQGPDLYAPTFPQFTTAIASLTANDALKPNFPVSIAQGGTGQIASSAALAALGGFASAGGTISGFTSLGTGNTAIKVKVITGTTSGSLSGYASVAHGLTGDKIIAIQAIVRQSANNGIPPEWSGGTDYLYRINYDATNINLQVGAGANFILSKAFSVIIFYVE